MSPSQIFDNLDWELNSFDAMEASLNVGFSEGGGATWQQGIFEQMLMLGLAEKPKVPKAFGRKYGCVAGQWMNDKFKVITRRRSRSLDVSKVRNRPLKCPVHRTSSTSSRYYTASCTNTVI